MSAINNNARKLITSLIILAMLFFTGCATVFKGTHDKVSMKSRPPAKVYVNGSYRGDTPLKLQLDSSKDYNIQFKKEGYQTKSVHVNNSVGAGWIVLDVVTGLVPVVVDAATGAWHKLDQKSINAELQKQQP